MLIVDIERFDSAAHRGGELRSVLDIRSAKATVPQLSELIIYITLAGADSAADFRLRCLSESSAGLFGIKIE